MDPFGPDHGERNAGQGTRHHGILGERRHPCGRAKNPVAPSKTLPDAQQALRHHLFPERPGRKTAGHGSAQEITFGSTPWDGSILTPSGLLLLTNDGEFAHRLTHPRFHVPKTYKVTVQGSITDEALNACDRASPWMTARFAGPGQTSSPKQ
jgi:hypothetical protein